MGKCEQCNHDRPVKEYSWKFLHDWGKITLCKECVEEYKNNGYKLEEEE